MGFRFLCRLKKEEAKITAWENLQKAKAEAAIQKLEVHTLLNKTIIHNSFFLLLASLFLNHTL